MLGKVLGLQESAGEPLRNPTPETWHRLDRRKMKELPTVCSTILAGATRSLGQRGQDHFEPGVPDALKGLGVGADKLHSSFGVPSH